MLEAGEVVASVAPVGAHRLEIVEKLVSLANSPPQLFHRNPCKKPLFRLFAPFSVKVKNLTLESGQLRTLYYSAEKLEVVRW
jgi:hypothetical protein